MFRSLMHLGRLVLSGSWEVRIAGQGTLGQCEHTSSVWLAILDRFLFFLSAKTVNSHALQCDLESLTRRTSYTVWVMASTRAGGTNGVRINFKTLSISEYWLQASFWSLLRVGNIWQEQGEPAEGSRAWLLLLSLAHSPPRSYWGAGKGRAELDQQAILILAGKQPQIILRWSKQHPLQPQPRQRLLPELTLPSS